MQTKTHAMLCSGAIALALGAGLLPVVATARTHTRAREACCRVPAGTTVEVELVDEIRSADRKSGDTFALRLAAPVIVDGRVVMRAGTPGVGTVINASHRGIGGKPADLVLAATALTVDGRQVPLSGLRLAGRGHDNSTPAQILEIGGIASLPLGIVGIALPGGGVVYKSGTVAAAKIAGDTSLPPLRRATRRDLAEAAAYPAPAEDDLADAAITLPAPPPGQGQVVFFRAKSLLGTAQWFNVRENGQALGKLSNGAYFVQPETPGVHTFTAKLEPELKDRLKLQIDPGETYFVEGTLTGGLVLSAADLTPSSVQKFNKAANHLKLAAAPTEAADQAASSAPASAAPASTAPQR